MARNKSYSREKEALFDVYEILARDEACLPTVPNGANLKPQFKIGPFRGVLKCAAGQFLVRRVLRGVVATSCLDLRPSPRLFRKTFKKK